MSNYRDALAWFKMALTDILRISRNFQARDYADCMFRVQFCSEKIIKGLILLYGIQFKKIHNPSIIIKNEILKLSSISEIERKKLKEIIDNASILEGLSTIPRYGDTTTEEFIQPEVIYNRKSVFSFLPQLVNVCRDLIEILHIFNKNDVLDQIIEELTNGIKRLQSIMDKK